MFHRILIPFDDTTFKLRALRVAKDLAACMHAEILLVQVEPPYSTTPASLAEAETTLAHRAAYLRSQGVHAEYVIEIGHREEALKAVARARQVDLILDVPLHRHHMELEWYSRGATHARTEMPAPMLIWSETATREGFLSDEDDVIVVPLDGSLESERALPFALMLAESFRRRIMLIRIVSRQSFHRQTTHSVDEQHLSGEQEAYQYLAALRSSIASVSKAPILVRIGIGDAADEILRLAKQHHIGALVVCAHSHTRQDRFFLGCVATQLMRDAETPVLIIPPHIALDATFPWIPTATATTQVSPPIAGQQ